MFNVFLVYLIFTSDVDPDPVRSGFIWVRGSDPDPDSESGSRSGSRGMKSLIKCREKKSLTNKNLFFSQEILFFKYVHKKSMFRVT